jgi:hypothetical protein
MLITLGRLAGSPIGPRSLPPLRPATAMRYGPDGPGTCIALWNGRHRAGRLLKSRRGYLASL